MEGEGANMWKFIETATLDRFWQNNIEKLAKRLPETPQILGCRFLNVLVLIRGFLLAYRAQLAYTMRDFALISQNKKEWLIYQYQLIRTNFLL